jgi:hypothetical protein
MATLDAESVPLSGSLLLTLQITGPAPLRVELPTRWILGNDWRVQVGSPKTTTPEQISTWQLQLRLEPVRPGLLPVPLAAVKVQAGTAPQPVSVEWPALRTTVTTTITQPDLADLRSITPIEAEPADLPASGWYSCGMSIGLAFALLIVLGALPRWRRQPISPFVHAIRALTSTQDWFAADQVLREYLNQFADLSVQTRTPAEFLPALRVSPELRDRLRAWFELCELGKFSGRDLPFDRAPVRQLLIELHDYQPPPAD